MSFVVLVAPLAGLWVFTSDMSRQAKIVSVGVLVALMLILPIAAFWLFGGGSGLS